MTATKRKRRARTDDPTPVAVPGAFECVIVAVPKADESEADVILGVLGRFDPTPVDVLVVARPDWPGKCWPPGVGMRVWLIPARLVLAEVET